MNMRDLAGWYLRALDELGLQGVNVIGFSLGGWLAAEMATMCPQQFNKMVLVGAAGIKPDIGEIFDIFLVTAEEYLDTVCLDNASVPEFDTVRPAEPSPEQLEAWLVAGEEACRLSWKPYMHYPGLPNLLGRLQELAHAPGMGSAGLYGPRKRRREVQPGNQRLAPRSHRQLRPPPRNRADRRVFGAGAGLSCGRLTPAPDSMQNAIMV